MNQVVRRGLNVGGGTIMMNIMLQHVDDVFILNSFVANNNIMSSSSSISSSTTTRVGMNNHVSVSNVVLPPWSMLDPTILFDSNSISNMAHHNPNVAPANRANYQNFQELFVAIDDDKPTTTKGGSSSKSADSDSTCCICLTELSTGSSAAVRMPKHCCSHLFHSDCIQEWLNVNMTCPLCRSDV